MKNFVSHFVLRSVCTNFACMKRLITAFCGFLVTLSALAQMVQPVQWSKSVRMTDDRHGTVTLTATIDDGWHLYGTDLPDGGPIPTSFEWKSLKGVKLLGNPKPGSKPHEQMDPTFDMKLRWWTGKVTFSQPFEATDPSFSLDGSIRYMACNDVTCTAPTTEPINLKGTAPKLAAAADTVASQPQATAADTLASETVATPVTEADTWAPVTLTDADASQQDAAGSGSLWWIFWACFGGGLLALLTPCVWPIIPMTVSFFLKKGDSRASAVSSAIIYGLAIIIIYVALGLAVTALFGASTLNAIATNAVANVVFFLLLVVFAISFFGAFNLELPASWSSRMDKAASSTTGLLSIFFMAFTLVIVSFSCTGPIIGTLLVEAAGQGSRMGPAVGMLGFAIALAIPFTLFALFPSWLKGLPKSGGWLNTVKVVLGFIELALSLKFLSVADLAYGWHILDREVFLSLWIAIFGLLGLYLLGVFRFKSDGEGQGHSIGVTRFFLALISLAFTAYLIPGLWGAPLRATSAFVPPLSTQDFNLSGEQLTHFTNYDEGMAAAARAGKPVFLDFSGYGCVNCRKMDGAVISTDGVQQLLNDNFISIELMVDDKHDLPAPRYVAENGQQVELTTWGDLWSYLQRHKFKANTQPQYFVLDAQGNLLSGPFTYQEDINAFIQFLQKGINNHAQ